MPLIGEKASTYKISKFPNSKISKFPLPVRSIKNELTLHFSLPCASNEIPFIHIALRSIHNDAGLFTKGRNRSIASQPVSYQPVSR
jgi:hypothetical protein